MNFEEICLKRRSNRFLSNEKLPNEVIEKILKAGMHAPVARGLYSNILIYKLEGEKLNKLQEIVKSEIDRDPTYNCGCLLLILHKGENKELRNQDAGCILENMALMASSIDIGNVYLYAITQVIKHSTKCLELLNIPVGYDCVASIGLGYKTSEAINDKVVHKIEVIE